MARDQQGLPGIPLVIPPAPSARLSQCQTLRLRLRLRDQRTVDGVIHLGDGQPLPAFLASREGGWVNLTNVNWQSGGERVPHVALKVGRILWATAMHGVTPLDPQTRTAATRTVKVTIENGVALQAELPMPNAQRLSDVLASCGQFLPVLDARMTRGGISFGDLVLNQDAVHVVEESPTEAGGSGERDVTARHLGQSAAPVVDPYRPVLLMDLERPATAPLDAERDRRDIFDPRTWNLLGEPGREKSAAGRLG